MKLKTRKGGAAGFIIFMFIVTVLASGAITFYTIFMKPEAKSTVPQFTGLSTAEAVSQAERLGLVVQVESVASTLPEGIVLAQSPQPETKLRKGLVVVLQVSRGGELHAIPDVKGKTLTQAQNEIKSGGFSLGDIVRINEPNVKAGTVIAQSPSAPANISAGGKIHLLVQDGGFAATADNITVPDVNRMTEAEAKNLLETSGIKVQGINRVYSPLLPEGLAIETTPTAGTVLKPGQGVMLKLATQKRPAGFMDANSNSSNVRRVANQPASNNTTNTSTTSTTNTQTANNNANKNVIVSVKGEEDVFIGDDYSTTLSATSTSNTAQKASTPSRASTTPQQTQTASQPSTNSSSGGGSKTARIRYVVPPIARPMDLRIEITDPSGKREIMNRQVRSGESINTTARYSQECMISIYLGGESVWQERQR